MNWSEDRIQKAVERIGDLFSTNPIDAAAYTVKLIEDATERRDWLTQLRLSDELAWFSIYRLEWQESYRYIEKAMQLAEDLDNTSFIARLHNYYGVLYDSNGEHLKAIQHYAQAFELNETLGEKDRCGVILSNIASFMHDLGSDDLALEIFEESSRIVGNAMPMDGLSSHAQTLFCAGKRTEAWRMLLDCRSKIRSSNLDESETNIQATIGWFFRCEGRLSYALHHYRKALQHTKNNRQDYYTADNMLEIAEILKEIGRRREAIDMLEQAIFMDNQRGFVAREQALLTKLLELSCDICTAKDVLKLQSRLQKLVQASDEKDRKNRLEFTDMQLESHRQRHERSKLMNDYIHDALTGLVSYSHYRERLHSALETNEVGAVLFMDMDHLKEVNDRDGHSAGDALLKSFAYLLRRLIPVSATAFRKGGDEFLVLLPAYDKNDTEQFISELQQKMAVTSEDGYHHACSIGAALWPSDSKDPNQLERMADEAMYAAKRAGGMQYRFY